MSTNEGDGGEKTGGGGGGGEGLLASAREEGLEGFNGVSCGHVLGQAVPNTRSHDAGNEGELAAVSSAVGHSVAKRVHHGGAPRAGSSGCTCLVVLVRVSHQCTLRAPLSGTFLQTLPDLVTPLKGHSLSPRSCPTTRSAPSERFGY